MTTTIRNGRGDLITAIGGPCDVQALPESQLPELAVQMRRRLIETVTATGGHLGAGLGMVELTIALHRVFTSPHDIVVFDTGHQTYPHKLLTGRGKDFATLRQADGLSGYPNRHESPHDWVENSHASVSLAWVDGIAKALALQGQCDRRVIAVIGDGALTGGVAWEGLNNLGAATRPVIVVLNDNGRSYDPTAGDATVGFELIAPTLMAEAARLGLAICHEESILGELVGVREQKLRKLGGSKINKHITAAFSVELAGQDGVGMLDVDNLQETNGSVKYSPSASAYFALHVKPGDKRALAYISSIIQAGDGGAPAFYQAEIFEIVWSLWNLSRTDIDLSDPEIVRTYLPYLDHVEQHWVRGRGVGWTGNSTLEDCDTTSVAYDVLSKFGRSPDIGAVLQFEDADWFRTYFHEVGPSISTNVHVLGALKQAGYDKCHPRVRKVLEFIRSSKEPGRFCWRDKWHRSAYYTTAHLICAASNYDDALCSDAIGWILNTQRPDGSWGFFDGQATAEETAYCIQALAHWQRHSGTSLSAQISRAGGWLSQHCEPPYAPLWIAKTLYCSATVVKAAILSALRLVDESNQ